jgi:hypothetical protein
MTVLDHMVQGLAHNQLYLQVLALDRVYMGQLRLPCLIVPAAVMIC